MSRPTNQDPAPLPERLARVTFFADRPGRPGSGLAAARALVALEAALGADGTQSHALSAELRGEKGGAVATTHNPQWWGAFHWENFEEGEDGATAYVWATDRVLTGGLRLFHPDGRVSEWRAE